MVRRRVLILVLTALVVMVLIAQCSATKSISVEKTVQQTDIEVGYDVTIMIQFTNPFGKEIPVRIVDKNIFGDNGIDIQCLERTLPSQKEITLAYDPIKPYAPGTYKLEAASVTYTNPETGKEETARSNELDIVVNGTAAQGQAQGITTIYECGGQSMRSTSYTSSGGSMNVRIGGSTGSSMDGSTGAGNQQKGDPGDRVRNNQLNQNTGALKEEMQQEMQKQEQMKKEFQKQLSENPEFQQKHQELMDKGYNLTNTSVNPASNNTGDFELGYQGSDGSTARLTGRMQNGSMKEMMSHTSEDEGAMLQRLEQNLTFQRLDEQLRDGGFERGSAAFDQLSQNHTKITIPYEDEDGEKREIDADYINGTIRDVGVVGEQERGGYPWWILLSILILTVVGWFVYGRYSNREVAVDVPPLQNPAKVDYVAISRAMIGDARNLFERGEEKEAYKKVSQAVRSYVSYKFGANVEITAVEAVHLLKRMDQDFRMVKECLNRCGSVEFAKLQPGRADFERVVEIAEEVVS
ncbi:MAG: hypothetical protein C4B59_09405 [Candidatus Methanogaster sp.]|uniref:Uncharacterized protein n=1 Tax=Candidatus Methanogaster sp. TaxID=3386292 RepID=A0AC61L2B3_9EURY|nr:MAG: hypothetical protein C4B59_09405 [ANME-2 cluster archaeon]